MTKQHTYTRTYESKRTESNKNVRYSTYTAEAKKSQKADAGAKTYCPSTTPNFKFCSKNCVSNSRIASVTSAKNITNIPVKLSNVMHVFCGRYAYFFDVYE